MALYQYMANQWVQCNEHCSLIQQANAQVEPVIFHLQFALNLLMQLPVLHLLPSQRWSPHDVTSIKQTVADF